MKAQCKISQGFGANATPTYVAGGLKGHSGVDNDCGYGSVINSLWDSEYVYKVLTKENPSNDGTGFTGIFTIVEKDGQCFEFLYGHCDPTVTVGQILVKGQAIGTQANNGEVYSNGVRITLDMQKAGDHRGTHRHDQARTLRKDKIYDRESVYITDANGPLFYGGYFYAIPFFNNGYRGCFDWTVPVKDDSKFNTMMLAIRDFQVSRGILDFQFENNPKKINLGPKTLSEIKNYK